MFDNNSIDIWDDEAIDALAEDQLAQAEAYYQQHGGVDQDDRS